MTKREKAQEAVFEQLVQAFVDGLVDDPPEAEEYGVSDERAQEIVAKAVAA